MPKPDPNITAPLPDDLASHLDRHTTDSLLYGVAALLDGQEVVAWHNEQVGERWRSTILTGALILQVEGDAEQKQWSGGQWKTGLEDAAIEASAWPLSQIDRVEVGHLLLVQEQGKNVTAAFERMAVHFSDGGSLALPAEHGEHTVEASAKLRSAIWAAWTATAPSV